MRLICFVQAKTLCRSGHVCISGCTCACVCGCDGDVFCVDQPEPVHWVVVSLRCKCYIVWVKGRRLVERPFYIDAA